MDSIFLRGIRLQTRIGVPEAERKAEQMLTVDVELFGSTKEVAAHDDISRGIDYAEVTAVVESVGETEHKTIEAVADDIAALLLKRFAPAGGVKVSVWKKPADLNIDSASVTIQRP